VVSLALREVASYPSFSVAAVPDPNIPGAHPEHLRQRHPRIGPMPHQGL